MAQKRINKFYIEILPKSAICISFKSCISGFASVGRCFAQTLPLHFISLRFAQTPRNDEFSLDCHDFATQNLAMTKFNNIRFCKIRRISHKKSKKI
ncbi:hypothetical protein [Helicobacter sp. 23-1045]